MPSPYSEHFVLPGNTQHDKLGTTQVTESFNDVHVEDLPVFNFNGNSQQVDTLSDYDSQGDNKSIGVTHPILHCRPIRQDKVEDEHEVVEIKASDKKTPTCILDGVSLCKDPLLVTQCRFDDVEREEDPTLTEHSAGDVERKEDPTLTEHSAGDVERKEDPTLTEHSAGDVERKEDPTLTKHSDDDVERKEDPTLNEHSDDDVERKEDPTLTKHSDDDVERKEDPTLTEHSDDDVERKEDPTLTKHSDDDVERKEDPTLTKHSDDDVERKEDPTLTEHSDDDVERKEDPTLTKHSDDDVERKEDPTLTKHSDDDVERKEDPTLTEYSDDDVERKEDPTLTDNSFPDFQELSPSCQLKLGRGQQHDKFPATGTCTPGSRIVCIAKKIAAFLFAIICLMTLRAINIETAEYNDHIEQYEDKFNACARNNFNLDLDTGNTGNPVIYNTNLKIGIGVTREKGTKDDTCMHDCIDPASSYPLKDKLQSLMSKICNTGWQVTASQGLLIQMWRTGFKRNHVTVASIFSFIIGMNMYVPVVVADAANHGDNYLPHAIGNRNTQQDSKFMLFEARGRTFTFEYCPSSPQDGTVRWDRLGDNLTHFFEGTDQRHVLGTDGNCHTLTIYNTSDNDLGSGFAVFIGLAEAESESFFPQKWPVIYCEDTRFTTMSHWKHNVFRLKVLHTNTNTTEDVFQTYVNGTKYPVEVTTVKRKNTLENLTTLPDFLTVIQLTLDKPCNYCPFELYFIFNGQKMKLYADEVPEYYTPEGEKKEGGSAGTIVGIIAGAIVVIVVVVVIIVLAAKWCKGRRPNGNNSDSQGTHMANIENGVPKDPTNIHLLNGKHDADNDE